MSDQQPSKKLNVSRSFLSSAGQSTNLQQSNQFQFKFPKQKPNQQQKPTQKPFHLFSATKLPELNNTISHRNSSEETLNIEQNSGIQPTIEPSEDEFKSHT